MKTIILNLTALLRHHSQSNKVKIMKIGEIILQSQAVMAPIAGITDMPYRNIVMEHGAGMVTSELLSANALIRDSGKTFDMMPGENEPGPVATQIFGGDPEVLRDAALIVQERPCDFIDLNFGCPVKKVTKCGGGAAMLKDLQKAERAVSMVASAVSKPVTVKIRTGWNSSTVNVVNMVKAIENAGAVAVAIHARTAAQGYSGEADWDLITKAASAVSIPVIGNGDITTPEKALYRLETSGCAFVMIGRGALGNPWIFRQINELGNTGSYTIPSREEIGCVILAHFNLMIIRYGEKVSVRKIRAHMGYYSRGIRGGARFRDSVNKEMTSSGMRRLISDFFINNREIAIV
ncbi:tRNA-dihydrouridine synthase DusB [hydrothermal vent metagenome]|uniref:tRNA-dihydrouridine synthase DusB n=1 Tax=hydrothermal vent metagenome TaxID=652676 RepID=A0A3B1BX42_9ZZZZ